MPFTYFWLITYEQCSARNTRFYTFDHPPIADGVWRNFQSDRLAAGRYRISGDFLQVVRPQDEAGLARFEELFRPFNEISPLPFDDVIEQLIDERPDGLHVWDSRILDEFDGIVISAITHSELTRAETELRDLWLRRRDEQNDDSAP